MSSLGDCDVVIFSSLHDNVNEAMIKIITDIAARKFILMLFLGEGALQMHKLITISMTLYVLPVSDRLGC